MTELELNENDQLIDTSYIPSPRGTFKRAIAGLLTVCSLYSASLMGPTKVKASNVDEIASSYSQSSDYVHPSTVIEIPEAYQYDVSSACGKKKGDPITVGDLNSIQKSFFSLAIRDESSLEWLNHIKGIEYLQLIIHTEKTDVLKAIKRLENVKSLGLATFSNVEFSEEDFSFLKKITNIESLSIVGMTPPPGFIEGLTHLKKLSLLTDCNYELDFSKLTFLDELSLHNPYDVAIGFTSQECEALIKSGVNITIDYEEDLMVFQEINKRLDEIVESLGLDEQSTEQEKLDAILCYVLDNLTYDPEVSEAIRNNTDHNALYKSFYKGGALYGALEKDTAICGNYAALTNALAERLGLNAYYLKSESHAWSLVEVEGEQYYVDATWLDGQKVYKQITIEQKDESGRVTGWITTYELLEPTDLIREGTTEELDWYMEDPNSYPKSNGQAESHIVINLPSYFGLKPQEETEKQETVTKPEEPTKPDENADDESTKPTENIDSTTQPPEMSEETIPSEPISLDGKTVELRCNNKVWFVSGAVAVGIMAGLGGAIAINNKKKKEAEKRRRLQQLRQQNILNDMLGYDSFDGDYGSSYGRTSYWDTNDYSNGNNNRRGRK